MTMLSHQLSFSDCDITIGSLVEEVPLLKRGSGFEARGGDGVEGNCKSSALAKNAIELLVLPALLLDLELPDQIQVRFSSFEIGGCCL